MNCVEKEFKLVPRKYEEYKGLRFRDGDWTSWLTCGYIEWMRMTQV
jgi:hypothetical protein